MRALHPPVPRRRARLVAATLAAGLLVPLRGSIGAPPEPVAADPGAPTRSAERAWLDDAGTAVLGFGLLRVSPSRSGVAGSLVLRYEERPGDYAAFDAVQLMILPADAFAGDGRAFADRTLAYARSEKGAYSTEVTIEVAAPALWIIGYGPFVGPDTGRPMTLARAYALEVTRASGVSRTFVDAEAGELQVKGWTGRPEVERGGPVVDPVTGRHHWFEVRPELVYDRDRLRAPGDPDSERTAAGRREADTLRSRAKDLESAGKADAAADLRREADDVERQLDAGDERIAVPAPLASRLRRLPFRWRG